MSPRLVTRIALFSSLIYVLSWGTSFLPNVNLVFFIVFSAGLMWGVIPGLIVGVVGMGLWSSLNPYGPATVPVMIAQMSGAAFSAPVGALFGNREWHRGRGWFLISALVWCAFCCTMLFYLPVNVVDAWVFQPFWPRFYGGMFWALISLASNVLIFPLLFGAFRSLYVRERAIRWSHV